MDAVQAVAKQLISEITTCIMPANHAGEAGIVLVASVCVSVCLSMKRKTENLLTRNCLDTPFLLASLATRNSIVTSDLWHCLAL